ncbi:lanC-like protein 2 isoform X3 [Ooceraea biroi]|uniref:lanC-like protein 2 isoform X3 n=1 Tax=Ooceraea biroi TaxID=2015173 RepID=UPI000F08A25E|nr:lanC-like protein 2 isoform X3 [Ooceraea biroi]
MDTNRYYKNPFMDYSSVTGYNIVDIDNNTIDDNFKSLLTSKINEFMKILEKNDKIWYSNNDYSTYTGLAGIAYIFYHYGKYYNNSAYVTKAMELLEKCIAEFKSRHEITFLTGIVGPLSLTAIMLHSQQKEEQANQLILRLKSFSVYILDKHNDISNELLYGRTGYLAALLYINENISPLCIEADLIRKVGSCIINSGITYASSNHSQSPLMYSWHEKEYVGGAHGLSGILYLLLQARHYLTQEQIDKYIKPSLYYLQGLQFSSGNFPSSIRNQSDRLVQWCHGAPGMSGLFCLAYKVFRDDAFLKTAIQCGEVTWERGLLRKGYSICHGVAGNGYTFIRLFQQTKSSVNSRKGATRRLLRFFGTQLQNLGFELTDTLRFLGQRPRSLYPNSRNSQLDGPF